MDAAVRRLGLQAVTGMCQTALFAVWERLLRALPRDSGGRILSGGGALQGFPVLAETDGCVGGFEHTLALDDIRRTLGQHDGG